MASSASLAFVAMILVALPITAFGFHWDDISPTAAGTSLSPPLSLFPIQIFWFMYFVSVVSKKAFFRAV